MAFLRERSTLENMEREKQGTPTQVKPTVPSKPSGEESTTPNPPTTGGFLMSGKKATDPMREQYNAYVIAAAKGHPEWDMAQVREEGQIWLKRNGLRPDEYDLPFKTLPEQENESPE